MLTRTTMVNAALASGVMFAICTALVALVVMGWSTGSPIVSQTSSQADYWHASWATPFITSEFPGVSAARGTRIGD